MGKKITQIKNITLDITKPMPMTAQEIELRMMNVIVGMNGTGKTFIMVTGFVLSQVATVIVHAKLTGEQLKMSAQFFVDNCFDAKDITGMLSAKFENDAIVRLVLEEGKVVYVYYDDFGAIEDIAPVRYMSSAMRTFSAIKMYLSSRKMAAKLALGDQNKIIELMVEDFKLFDVMHVEGLIMKMPLKADSRMQEYLADFDIKEEIEEFGVDLDKNDFFLIEKKDKNKKYMTMMGAGHQSIYNMLLGSL